MELNDFVSKIELTLDQFDKGKDSKKTPLGTRAASHLAATTVIPDSPNILNDFRQTKEDLLDPEKRQKFLVRQVNQRERIITDLDRSLVNITLDGQLSDTQKQMYFDAVRTADRGIEVTTLKAYADESLADHSDINETETAAESRNIMVDVVNDVMDKKRQIQIMINKEMGEKDPSMKETIVDIAEFMVPFAEWIDVDNLQKDVFGEDYRLGLMGSQKDKLYREIQKLPVNKRVDFAKAVIELVRQNEQMILPDGNDLAKLDRLENMLLDNNYSDAGKWFDNVISVLDFAVGVGSLIKGVGRVGGFGGLAKRIVRTDVSPVSTSQILKDTNPGKARATHRVVVEDDTGEAAEAMYGTTREEAIAKDLLAEPELQAGRIENKVQMSEVSPEPINITRARKTDGQSYLTENEVIRVEQNLIDGLKNLDGNLRAESLTISTTEDGSVLIRGLYTPVDSGFATAEKALDSAVFSFRNYGLSEDNFELYVRVGDEWELTTKAELNARKQLRDEFVRKKKAIPPELKDIDYAFGVKWDYGFKPEDLEVFDVLDTKRNWFDRIPVSFMAKSGQGSVQQHVLDAASVLHPQIVEPASVAVDRGTHLRKLYVDEITKSFAKPYAKLSTDSRASVTNYIHEANFDGIKFDLVDLKSRGFNSKEIEVLRGWRKSNDIMYHGVNADMVKNLRDQGFMYYIDKANNTKLVAKGLPRNSVNSSTAMYDSATDTIITMTKSELDEWYIEGSKIARLPQPVKVGDEWVDMVKVNESPETGYLRALSDNDTVLAYRDGYYPVMYDANFFITKQVKMADGSINTKVVATSKTQQEARQALTKLRESDPESVYDFRPDRREAAGASEDFGESAFSIGANSGLSAQKVRGRRLADAGVDIHKAGYTNLKDPLKAIEMQINALSQRTSMRNYLDTTKKRWLDNFGDVLDLKKDRYGDFMFPGNVSQIAGTGDATAKQVADARTLFNYITTLENGYINGIDTGLKATLNAIADVISEVGLPKDFEGFLRATGDVKSTRAVKSAVFKAYLASNPARQLIIQGHQTIQLTAIHPTYVWGPKAGLTRDLIRLGKAKRGDTSDTEALKMWKELKRSGVLEAVDSNNLIRSDLLHLADLTNTEKAKSLGMTPINFAQKVGFDTAEQSVLVTSWLTHYDMAKAAGKPMTRRTFDEIAGKSRAFTYNMNRAGDMPYNQNSLNIIAQFLQVPHKAFIQPFFNRSLTRKQRLQLLGFNGLMYGVPTGGLTWLLNDMEPSEARDVLERGLEDVLLNATFSSITGEEQNIDWGDLAPSDLYGTADFLVSLMTTDVGTVLANSPGGSLLFGNNSKTFQMFKTASRYFNLIDDYDDPELETRFSDVSHAALSMFSGYSNAFKATYAMKSKQKINSVGTVVDSDITSFEAALALFGFQTHTESTTREIKQVLLKESGRSTSSFSEDDVQRFYTDLKRHLARRGMTVEEQDFTQRVLSEAYRVFEDDSVMVQKKIYDLIVADAKRGDASLVNNLMNQIGLMDNRKLTALIERLPDSKPKEELRIMMQEFVKNEEERRKK